jgi:hypothetical protein
MFPRKWLEYNNERFSTPSVLGCYKEDNWSKNAERVVRSLAREDLVGAFESQRATK